MYELGFDFQATPSSFCVNRSAAGAKCVAQTTLFSCSDKSPAKHSCEANVVTKPGPNFCSYFLKSSWI